MSHSEYFWRVLMRFATLLVVLELALSASSIGITRYVVTTSLVLDGKGIVDKGFFSKAFRIAPEIPGWQRVASMDLFVNSARSGFETLGDLDGNLFAYPGDLRFSGTVNITLVQEVEVYRPPYRLIREAPAVISASPVYAQDISTSPFWGCNSSGKKFADVAALARELGGSHSSTETVIKVAGWVKSNIEYDAGGVLEGGSKCPAKTLEEGRGTCGDIHALLTALLRLNGFNALLAYAYVYIPGKRIEVSIDKWNYTLVGLEPHIFTVINSSGTVFPIDLTANVGRNPGEIIRGSAVNSLDNVIVMAWISRTAPNDFLAIYAPSGATKVNLRVAVRARWENSYTLPAVIIAAAALLVLSKEKAT